MIVRTLGAALSPPRDNHDVSLEDVPFGWFDAPPSLNRLLGVQWLARILHPGPLK